MPAGPTIPRSRRRSKHPSSMVERLRGTCWSPWKETSVIGSRGSGPCHHRTRDAAGAFAGVETDARHAIWRHSRNPAPHIWQTRCMPKRNDRWWTYLRRSAGELPETTLRAAPHAACHLPRITSIPARIRASFARGNFPTHSVNASLSNAITWETFATESCGSPVMRCERATLPGASAHRRLPVRGAHTAVEMRLRLRASP